MQVSLYWWENEGKSSKAVTGKKFLCTSATYSLFSIHFSSQPNLLPPNSNSSPPKCTTNDCTCHSTEDNAKTKTLFPSSGSRSWRSVFHLRPTSPQTRLLLGRWQISSRASFFSHNRNTEFCKKWGKIEWSSWKLWEEPSAAEQAARMGFFGWLWWILCWYNFVVFRLKQWYFDALFEEWSELQLGSCLWSGRCGDRQVWSKRTLRGWECRWDHQRGCGRCHRFCQSTFPPFQCTFWVYSGLGKTSTFLISTLISLRS